MKIFELYNPNVKREDFDLVEDLAFFMRNDPQFYRQDYFPFLQKFNRHCDAGRTVTAKAFIPIVKRAFNAYQTSFPVEGLESSLSDNDLEEICERLQSEEAKFYHEEKQKNLENKNEVKTAF
jgi:hypothetical protein